MTPAGPIRPSRSWRNNTTSHSSWRTAPSIPTCPGMSRKKYFDMYPLDQIALPELKEDDLDDLPPLAKAVSDGIGSFADKVIESGKLEEAVQAYLATTTLRRYTDRARPRCSREKPLQRQHHCRLPHRSRVSPWRKTSLAKDDALGGRNARLIDVSRAGSQLKPGACLNGSFP